MDIRRTILWMIFTFSLLLLWNNWQEYNGQASLFSSGTAQQTQAATANATPASDASIPAGQAPQAAAPAALPGNSPASIAQGEMIEVTTDVYKLTFSTQGAQLVKAALLKYDTPDHPGEPQLLLDDSASSIYIAQSGVIGSRGEQWPNHLSQFTLVSSERVLQGDSMNVVFEAESNGIKVIKTYTLSKGRYDIQVHHDIQNTSGETLHPSLYLQLTRDGNNPPDSSRLYNTFTGPAVYSEEGRYQKISFSDIDKDKAKYEKTANNGWIGMVQHYFATAWVPVEGVERTNQALKLGDNLYAIRSIEAAGSIDAGSSKTLNAQLWVGPQDQKAMAAVAPGLDLVVDYGWLTIISKPLFKILTWLHALLGNWGWSIVALTVLIKLVFFPLSAASYRSMAKMKKFTPRMQALREKYGDDKAKLNAAMMEMYRTEKINPLGGCLPMVVQIPVFIALYWVLLGSVEMRGAPWILWIHNLAVPDPWFILPAIMMGTMFLQIKLNPTPPDPMQARVMMLMPLVFGGMMFFFPAGLVLYWCVNNILSIAQQQYITRKLEKQTSQAANS